MSKENTTVIISCAGMGTRLGIGMPKALVNVDGKPLIIRQLEMLMYGREAQSKTRIASPATIPKSGERNRKIHSCMLYLISI